MFKSTLKAELESHLVVHNLYSWSDMVKQIKGVYVLALSSKPTFVTFE